MKLPSDKKLLDTCVDVVIRFKGHGSYKGHSGAIKALSRRGPGFEAAAYQTTFDSFCELYDKAVDAIERHPAARPDKKSIYAEFEDVDFEACMRELDMIHPGSALAEKKEILNWVIFWHYLK